MQQSSPFAQLFGFVFLLVIAGAFLLLLTPEKKPVSPNFQEREWRATTSFQIARRAPAAVATQGYLYIIGGIDNNHHYPKEVEFAPIHEDGSLGDWQTTSSLLEGRFYVDAVELNGYLYAIGGANGPLGANNIPIASVERAKILDNGELGTWRLVNYLSTPRRGLKALQYKNQIFAIGGYNGIFLQSIESTSLHLPNALTEWQDQQPSLLDRYIHSAARYNNFVYLLGGHVQGKNKLSYSDVEMSTISADGKIGNWTIEKSTLLQPRFISSSMAINGYLYLLGGHDGVKRLNSVEYTQIKKNGHIGKWQFNTPMLFERSAAAIASYNNTIYMLGGMGNQQILNNVEYAKQFENGVLGFIKQSR